MKTQLTTPRLNKLAKKLEQLWEQQQKTAAQYRKELDRVVSKLPKGHRIKGVRVVRKSN